MLVLFGLIGCIFLSYPLLWIGFRKLLDHRASFHRYLTSIILKSIEVRSTIVISSIEGYDRYSSVLLAELAYRKQHWDPNRYQTWAIYLLDYLFVTRGCLNGVRHIVLVDGLRLSYIYVPEEGVYVPGNDKREIVLKLDTSLYNKEACRLHNMIWLAIVSIILCLLLMASLLFQ